MSIATIELVWTTSGPALTAARAVLAAALTQTGALDVWEEWKADDPLRPRRLRPNMNGPCVYVNGRLAWGPEKGSLDEAALAQAIAHLSTLAAVPRTYDPLSRRIKYVLVPSAALALVPKCPLCWMAYAGITAAFGLTPLAARELALLSLTVAVGVAVGAILLRSAKIRDKGVLWPLGIGAALAVLGGHEYISPAFAYVGLLAMLAAAVWSAWPRTLAGAA
jgi:hypothetical protein